MRQRTEGCKIVIVGGGGVGKSALTIQLVQKFFIEDYDPTIEDAYLQEEFIDDEECRLDILDTAGHEDYTTIRGDQHLRYGEGFLCVYSVTQRTSFDEICSYREQILGCNDKEIPMVLVGNKCDLERERQVSIEEGQELAKAFNCSFYETSAKSRMNIENIFYQLIRDIRKERISKRKPPRKSLEDNFKDMTQIQRRCSLM